ncbi:MAG TPA: iron-sulfur cluster assembly protein [Mycobacterium sp.]|jgi:metal-sulfur cluster biosynthetic enzyme|nr:iron-sulfur cluster assembly protein [Mycobacterium sp.]
MPDTQLDTATVEKALQGVIDPCSKAMGQPMDIVTMGLVERIDIADGKVTITVILTDPNCFFFSQIEQFVGDVLAELPGVDEVDVQISSTTLWSSDRIRTRLPVTVSPGHYA